MNDRLTDEEAECIAQHITARLVERLSDETTVNAVVAVWSRALDQIIGRGFRKVVWILVVFFVGMAFIRLEHILPFFGIKP